ncbi:MAG: hypothetical protein KTR15_07020 [Phycisphaeraceae bacterium]|nr:hypothetical protein [Phycisphaeraceae bacterium]
MRQNSFNIVGLAVALLCVIVFATIAVAVSEANRRTGPRIFQQSTQLRGIHQSLVTYANSNENWFPGIDELGEDARITVEQRFQILIEEDYFTPEYAISPSETEDVTEWDAHEDGKDPITAKNYSFAMLQIPSEGGRREEWSQTVNSQAIVISDRNTGTQAMPSSIHTKPGEQWRGSVLWNDNHAGYEQEDVFETKYGGGLNPSDKLFEAEGEFDALMIHSGN